MAPIMAPMAAPPPVNVGGAAILAYAFAAFLDHVLGL